METGEQRFWRLFAGYEKLVTEESFAIESRNPDYLGDIIAKKETILQTLVDSGASLLEKLRQSPQFNKRMTSLVDCQQENLSHIQEGQEKARKQLGDLEAGIFRARGFRKKYILVSVGESRAGVRFRA